MPLYIFYPNYWPFSHEQGDGFDEIVIKELFKKLGSGDHLSRSGHPIPVYGVVLHTVLIVTVTVTTPAVLIQIGVAIQLLTATALLALISDIKVSCKYIIN